MRPPRDPSIKALESVPRVACHLLGCSPSMAYGMVRRGELPGVVRLGGRWWVRTAVLHRWLVGQDEAPPEVSS